MTANILNVILLAAMVATVFLILRQRHLFVVVILGGMYSLLAALMFVIFDAVDVAFTEASVGAGIATVLYLATLALTVREEAPGPTLSAIPLLVVSVAGVLLMLATTDMPVYGDPTAPMHTHVVPYYLSEGMRDTGVPNIVTAVLASYRGFDTLGETVVIFTAGTGVLALMWRFRGSTVVRASETGPGDDSPDSNDSDSNGGSAGGSESGRRRA